jgi:ABC-type Mn2+/Zn2+ transport system ATPase subunit
LQQKKILSLLKKQRKQEKTVFWVCFDKKKIKKQKGEKQQTQKKELHFFISLSLSLHISPLFTTTTTPP